MATEDDLRYAAQLYDRYAKEYDDYNYRHKQFASVADYDRAYSIYMDFVRSKGIKESDFKKYRSYKDY